MPKILPLVTDIELDAFGGAEPDQRSEVKRLRKTNPLYDKMAPQWNFFLDAYQGGEDFTNRDNVFKHFRENEQDFTDRVARLHNMNYLESLVDFFTNFIFSESIDRNGGSSSAFYDQFIANVNLRGDGIDRFMRDVCDDMQIFGITYVLVDAPPIMESDDPEAVDAVITEQDLKDTGWRPYWLLIKPMEVTDWVVDDLLRLKYLKRKQCSYKLIDNETAEVERYTEYFLDRVVVTEVDVTKSAKPRIIGRKEFPNKLGIIPFIIGRYKRDKKNPFLGLSFLRDFAGNQREILNLSSVLQEFLYRQAFNILAKETDSNIPMKEQEDGVIGSSNIMEYPKGAKTPAYITPPVDPAKFIQDERQRIKNEMFLRASQDAINELFNGEKSSGFSQAQSFYKTVPFISSRADELESIENKLMELTLQMMGKDWNGKVRYKDRYELTNLTDALAQFQILVRDFQMPSEVFVKEELKRMIREFDGKLPIDLRTQVEAQIDAMDFKSWMEIQKEALVGSPAAGAAGGGKGKDTMTLSEHASEAGVKTTKLLKQKD